MRAALLALAALLAWVPALALAQPGPVPVQGDSIAPAGASVPVLLSTILAQRGVLLDTFKVAGDADDTAALNRATAAGVCILLGPKTYSVKDFSTGVISSFCLKGIKGQSVIQRPSASGGTWFGIKAAGVVVDGVIFDGNSGSVSSNQWGVFLNQGGQTVSATNNVFKNMSGTLGSCFALVSTGPGAGGSFNFSDNEVTNCSFDSLLLGSVSNGIVSRNYIHDIASFGIFAGGFGTVSGTNYLSNVLIDSNTVVRSASTGITVGGIASPFTFGTPAATHVQVSNNLLQDNTLYAISLEGDYCDAIGNHISQSAPGATVFGAIDTLERWGKIQNNTVAFANTNFAIDIGGSQGMLVTGNVCAMTQGSCYNTGGNLDSLISGNTANVSGTASGVTNYNVEGTGGGGIFPTLSSGTVIENNVFNLTGESAAGIQIFNNSGGGLNAKPTLLRGNKFYGGNPNQDITFKGTSHSIIIDGNQHGTSPVIFGDPNGGGDLIFDPVQFGGFIQGASGSVDIRSIVMRDTGTYGAGGSVLWTTPTAVGSAYTAATTIGFTGTGCTGQTASPQISAGQIIGVKMTNVGSGCSGTVTAAATDSGGGSGATFSVGTVPQMPDKAQITYQSNATRVLKASGGFVSLKPQIPLQLEANDAQVTLEVIYGGVFWQVVKFMPPTIAIGSLPTCDATHSGAVVNVSGSVSGKWSARCNATNWIAPDGVTIN